MVCLRYQYGIDFNELLVSRWCMEEEHIGKHNKRQKLREDKRSHLYTVHHPAKGFMSEIWPKKNSQSAVVLHRIPKARHETCEWEEAGWLWQGVVKVNSCTPVRLPPPSTLRLLGKILTFCITVHLWRCVSQRCANANTMPITFLLL